MEQSIVPEMTTKPVNHQVAIIPRNTVRRHLTAPPAIKVDNVGTYIVIGNDNDVNNDNIFDNEQHVPDEPEANE